MDAKVYELARRARELLVSKYTELGIESQAARLMEQGHQPGGVHYAAICAIIAALTPPEGYVLVPEALTEPMLDVMWRAEGDMRDSDMQSLWAELIAARPEVSNVND